MTTARFLSLSLATLDARVPAGPDWIYEAKLDGYRIEAVRNAGGQITLFTRNALDWTDRFPRVVDALAAWPIPAATLDGEIVAMVAAGRSSFQALQQAMLPGADVTPVRLRYVVFDLLRLDGHDVRRLPLRDRQTLLRESLALRPPRSLVQPVRRFAPRGDVLATACAAGLEGLVCKRLDAPYQSGRHRQWLKVKCSQRQEFVVVGFTEPRGARAGIGALLLGVFDAQHRLHFAGKVGTGFGSAELLRLRAQLEPLVRADAPVVAAASVPRRSVHWVAPVLVAEVRFTEWTDDGLLRHPVYHGLRADKPARAVRRETSAE
jgi:bifunctional non-homologous end joining protein LigD